MNRTLLGFVALGLLAASTGCHALGRKACPVDSTVAVYAESDCSDGSCGTVVQSCGMAGCAVGGCGDGCGCGPGCLGIGARLCECAHRNCRGLHHGLAEGPTMGAVTYPYYTVRGPRDFLLDDPPSIGP